jgi:hypothetical protein
MPPLTAAQRLAAISSSSQGSLTPLNIQKQKPLTKDEATNETIHPRAASASARRMAASMIAPLNNPQQVANTAQNRKTVSPKLTLNSTSPVSTYGVTFPRVPRFVVSFVSNVRTRLVSGIGAAIRPDIRVVSDIRI